MLRNTSYAIELASADLGGSRIERILIKEGWEQTVRFSDWRGGRFNPRALEIPEGELLVLIGDAVAAGVFSPSFLRDLGPLLRYA